MKIKETISKIYNKILGKKPEITADNGLTLNGGSEYKLTGIGATVTSFNPSTMYYNMPSTYPLAGTFRCSHCNALGCTIQYKITELFAYLFTGAGTIFAYPNFKIEINQTKNTLFVYLTDDILYLEIYNITNYNGMLRKCYFIEDHDWHTYSQGIELHSLIVNAQQVDRAILREHGLYFT